MMPFVNQTKKNILIVEDDEDIRNLVSELLSLEGHQVSTAANGKLALDVLQNKNDIELVVLDLMMPVMDGQTFIKAIRNQKDHNANIPIILLTASGKKAEEVRDSVQGLIKK